MRLLLKNLKQLNFHQRQLLVICALADAIEPAVAILPVPDIVVQFVVLPLNLNPLVDSATVKNILLGSTPSA